MPAGFDAVAYVSRMLARVPWAHEVEVVLHTDLAVGGGAVSADARRALEPLGEHVLMRLRAESLDWAAGLLAGAGFGFTVRRPAELREALRALSDRLTAA